MKFFSTLINPPEIPPPIPAQLPKITAPTAAQIAEQSAPSPAARQLLTPQQTPSQYLTALQEKKMGDEMVKTLAHGMPDREGVQWAAQSAGKVADKLPAPDAQALQAAQAWVKNPTAATQAAAAAAAGKTEMKTPAALAAQAAAWAQPAAPAAPTAAKIGLPRLAPLAVSGAVLLAAGMSVPPAPAPKSPKIPSMPPAPDLATVVPAAPTTPPPTVPPKVQAQMFQSQQPFIAMGIDLASGKVPVG